MNSFRQHTASLNLAVDEIVDELKKTGSKRRGRRLALYPEIECILREQGNGA